MFTTQNNGLPQIKPNFYYICTSKHHYPNVCKMQYSISLVEDNYIFCKLLKIHLQKEFDLPVHMYTQGMDYLKKQDRKPEIICLDYNLPDITGLELLQQIKKKTPDSYVIIISAQDNLEVVAKLMKNGAFGYITKGPLVRHKLTTIITAILNLASLKKENLQLKDILSNRYDFRKTLKGKSKAFNNVYKLMGKAAGCKFPVLITGETGTGKELIAKAIHFNSKRKNAPFVAVNISAIPPTLIESEFFGHEKGSFTGAIRQRIGKFEQANNGTLFLDEIGDLDISLQSKLLRVLEEQELERVGGNETVKLNVRLITATHRNLDDMIRESRFRQDLYYRIKGLPIEIPPLRKRDNDIDYLAHEFSSDYCINNNLAPKTITRAAQQRLNAYSFPGNIRELKAIIELACVLSSSDLIDVQHLQFNSNITEKPLFDKEKSLKQYNFEILKHYLDKYHGNILQISKLLKVSRPTLYRMIKEMDGTKQQV